MRNISIAIAAGLLLCAAARAQQIQTDTIHSVDFSSLSPTEPQSPGRRDSTPSAKPDAFAPVPDSKRTFPTAPLPAQTTPQPSSLPLPVLVPTAPGTVAKTPEPTNPATLSPIAAPTPATLSNDTEVPTPTPTSAATPPAPAGPDPVPVARTVPKIATIAVLDPRCKGGLDSNEQKSLGDLLRGQISATSRFRTTGRARIDSAALEIPPAGDSAAWARALGERLQADRVLTWSISRIGLLYTVGTRVQDASDGAVLENSSKDYVGEPEVLAEQAVPDIASELAYGHVSIRSSAQRPGAKDEDEHAFMTPLEQAKDDYHSAIRRACINGSIGTGAIILGFASGITGSGALLAIAGIPCQIIGIINIPRAVASGRRLDQMDKEDGTSATTAPSWNSAAPRVLALTRADF